MKHCRPTSFPQQNVDTLIRSLKPEDTRKYVIGAFEMLYAKREDRPAKKHGTI